MADYSKQFVKQAMLSAAAKALDYKAKNPKLSDNDVIAYMLKSLDEVLKEVY